MKKEKFLDIWYFNEPTIGFCPNCEIIATWTEGGLCCPDCGKTNISVFKWDSSTPHPEFGEE